ncbi:MAG: hypothetical protein AAGI72_02130 [Pseudomonadota bacterium]
MKNRPTLTFIFLLGVLLSANTKASLLFSFSTASGNGSFEIDTSVAPTVPATCGPSGFIFDACYEDAVTNVMGAALGVFSGTTDVVLRSFGGSLFSIDINVPPLVPRERFVSFSFRSSADLLSGLPTDPTEFFTEIFDRTTNGIISDNEDIQTLNVATTVPVPATLLLCGLGWFLALGASRRRG